MTAHGYKQTSSRLKMISALPPKADIQRQVAKRPLMTLSGHSWDREFDSLFVLLSRPGGLHE